MKVTFVCTGNTCRSPMAEYLMRDYCKNNRLNIEVQSRGLACSNGAPMSDNALEALSQLGIDGSSHRSSGFTLKDLFESDCIIAMTKAHKDALAHYFNCGDKVRTFGEMADCGDINDPYGLSLSAYCACRDAIAKGVAVIAEKLENSRKPDEDIAK